MTEFERLYNEKKGTIYVTGKHWPKLFEIKTF